MSRNDASTLGAPGRIPLTWGNGSAIFFIAIVGMMGANLIPLIMTALTEQLGLSVVTAGSVATGLLLATAVVGLISARWATGPRRRTLAASGLAIAAVGFGIAALVPVTGVALSAMMLGGAGAGAAISTSGAALAGIRNPNRVNAASGLTNRIVVAIVLAAVPLFGVAMGSAFGALAVLSLIGLALVPLLPLAPRQVPAQAAAEKAPAVAGPQQSRGTLVAGALLLVLFPLWAISEDSIWAISGVMGAEQAALTEAQLGFALSVSALGGALGAVVVMLLGSRGGRVLPVVVLLTLGGLAKILLSQTSDPTLYTWLLIGWNTLYAVAFIYFASIAAGLDSRGRWSGPLLGAYLVGSSFAPVIGGALAEGLGYAGFGWTVGIASFLILIPLALVARTSMRNEAAESRAAREEGAVPPVPAVLG